MREPIAIWSGPSLAIEPRRRVFDERLARGEILGPDAAHQRAGGDAVGGRHHLAGHQRRDGQHVSSTAQAVGDLVEVGQALGRAAQRDMTVETEHAAEQLGAKATHHREHDDQRADAERDAEQREQRRSPR